MKQGDFKRLEDLYFEHTPEAPEFLNFESDIADKHGRMLVKMKEKVIVGRLKAAGYVIDLEKEKQKRFKSLTVEQTPDKETWYFDNGQPEALRVVTFKSSLNLGTGVKVVSCLNYY